MDSQDHTQRRRKTIAKEWQLDVLKRLHASSRNPTEEQRSAAAAETGLDDKWVRDWFARQRSKVAARNRRRKPVTTEPAHCAAVPVFKLQQYHPPMLPSGSQGSSYRRSVSRSIDPALCLSATSSRQPSPASLASHSSGPTRSTMDAEATPHRSVSAPLCPNGPSQNPMLDAHNTTTLTYSRDPLCNRYPDFSHFFCPHVHERFSGCTLAAPINNHHHIIQLLANRNMPSHFHDLSNPDGLLAHPPPCPVAFSMRLVDLLG